MSSTYYHYTDAKGAKGILAEGVIKPDGHGHVFLSPTKYEDANVARQKLAITRKRLERRLSLAASLLPASVVVAEVEPKWDADNQLLLSGLGSEVVITGRVELPVAVAVMEGEK